jgi:NAD-dependent SIR2 family protein deacetylase
MYNNNIDKIIKILKKCRNLIITAGAGMGVDSGLPDFRSNEGFWRNYPPYKKLNLSFYELANPATFIINPELAWGFYGHRLNLYRRTEPHKGFYYIKEWIKKLSLNFFIITSNVDGQFQKSGFDEKHIFEIHGSIHYLQCSKPCLHKVWDNKITLSVDEFSMKSNTIPTCQYCGHIARPNILMFGDNNWVSTRSDIQSQNFSNWMNSILHEENTVILEIGAGKAVPTIRNFSYNIANLTNGIIMRINPYDYNVESPHISIPMKAIDALELVHHNL